MPRRLMAALIVAACGSRDDSGALNEVPADVAPVVVRPAFTTQPLAANSAINGAAFHDGGDGARWIIATTTSHVLAVFDAATGAMLRTAGVRGTGMGELGGPQGIVLLGDSIALVVERDNGRVQGFHLPDFKTIGTFGDRLIGKPSAVTAHLAGNAYDVYVAYNSDSATTRIAQFRLTVGNGELIAIHWRTFGDSSGNGAIHSPAGMAVDGAHDRLLIADAGSAGPSTRVYDLDGRFTGRVINTGNAGIALYPCNDERGYWVAGHRGDSASAFHVFDRESLSRVGAFADTAGQLVRILAASARPAGPLPLGGAFAARADGSLAAISWGDVATALKLRDHCTRR